MKNLIQLTLKSFLALASAWMLALSTFGQFTDTVPPTLVSATFNPNPVDVTTGDASVTLSLHVTDDLSGIDFAANSFGGIIEIIGPSNQYFYLYTWNFVISAGSPGDLDTTWDTTFTVFRGTENGNWKIQYLSLYDLAGNLLSLPPPPPAPNPLDGFDPLVINSITDTVAPTIMADSPAAIDASTDGQYVSFNLYISDDSSGVGLDDGSISDYNFVQIYATSPNGLTSISGYMYRTEGDRNNGTWQANIYFPRYSASGTWPISINIADNARNFGGTSTSVDVFSDPSDDQAPTVTHVTLSPITIDTSGSKQAVSATVTASDNLSGIYYAYLFLRSPSGQQQQYIYCYPHEDGTISGTNYFPRYSEAGTWKVYYMYAFDNAYNFFSANLPPDAGPDLAATLNVILPTLDTDGTVDDTGGTVTDPVFGDRASVTIPAGTLSAPTTVAIDVLADPLQVPLPTGFAGANTLYVNIKLNPEPVFPLNPPGLTVVLPLAHPMAPGTILQLWRISEATGQLEPSLDFFGNQVVGTVNATGDRATFTGISHLSTVVGLLPDPVITWNNPADITYGTALSGIQLNATANLPGSFSYTPAAGTVLGFGLNQTLSVKFTPDDTDNYHPITKQVSINVKKATLKVIADNKTKIAGQGNPPLTVHYDGFVNGDGSGSLSVLPNASTLANAGSAAGNYDINVSGAAADNYDFQYFKGTLTVLPLLNFKAVAYQLVSSKRITATVWEYVYKFQLKNDSTTKAYNVSAQLNTWPSQFSVIDGSVTFGTMNAGATATSQDTFTVRIDRAIAVQNSDLNWKVSYSYDGGGTLTTAVTMPLK